jgi:4-hydroxy-tetrahydrodipicolinate synthase
MGPRFGEVITAMVTPFDDDLNVDLDAAVELARWLVDHGSDGLVVTGTTGEGPTLDDTEKADLWRAVAEAVTVPVIAGTGTNETRHTVMATKQAADIGVAGVLVVVPYYNRPSQAGIDVHIRAAAEAAGSVPVVVYDIPVRTGRKATTDTLLRLAREVPNVLAVKDAAGNPGESARLIAEAPDGFELYSGDDSMTLPLLAVGAVGVIGVATHWAGPVFGEMITAFGKGDVLGARRSNERLLASFDYETGDEAPNPAPTKALLRELGLRVGRCRPPMSPEPDWLAGRARDVLAGLTT